MWVSENRVLRKIFGRKRDEVVGSLRKLHNEELHNSYTSPNIIRMIKSMRVRWAGNVVCMEENRDVRVYRILMGISKGKRPQGIPKYMWNVIKMHLKKIGQGGRGWINLTQNVN
jgi:hypothetical protein